MTQFCSISQSVASKVQKVTRDLTFSFPLSVFTQERCVLCFLLENFSPIPNGSQKNLIKRLINFISKLLYVYWVS